METSKDEGSSTANKLLNEPLENVKVSTVRKSARPRKKSKRVLDTAVSHTDGTTEKEPKRRKKGKPKEEKHSKERPENGPPFECTLCGGKSVNPNKVKGKSEPIIKEKDGRKLTLCVDCGIAVNHTENKGPSHEQKQQFELEGQQFARHLASYLQDNEATRLYCSFYAVNKCGCIQNFITGTIQAKRKKYSMPDPYVPSLLPEECMDPPDDKADKAQRAKYLLKLLKESKRKKALQVLKKRTRSSSNQSVTSVKSTDSQSGGEVSAEPTDSDLRGVARKRLENFILAHRAKLRKIGICERGCQRVLCYSNNFLHKKSVSGKEARLQRTKGKAALGQLDSVEDLPRIHCCEKKCVKFAELKPGKVSHWRSQAQQSQRESWKVISEMLGSRHITGGSHHACCRFISLVTGCCIATIRKIYAQTLLFKSPVAEREHGLRGHKMRRKFLSESEPYSNYPKKPGLPHKERSSLSISEPTSQSSFILQEAASRKAISPPSRKLETSALPEKRNISNARASVGTNSQSTAYAPILPNAAVILSTSTSHSVLVFPGQQKQDFVLPASTSTTTNIPSLLLHSVHKSSALSVSESAVLYPDQDKNSERNNVETPKISDQITKVDVNKSVPAPLANDVSYIFKSVPGAQSHLSQPASLFPSFNHAAAQQVPIENNTGSVKSLGTTISSIPTHTKNASRTAESVTSSCTDQVRVEEVTKLTDYQSREQKTQKISVPYVNSNISAISPASCHSIISTSEPINQQLNVVNIQPKNVTREEDQPVVVHKQLHKDYPNQTNTLPRQGNLNEKEKKEETQTCAQNLKAEQAFQCKALDQHYNNERKETQSVEAESNKGTVIQQQGQHQIIGQQDFTLMTVLENGVTKLYLVPKNVPSSQASTSFQTPLSLASGAGLSINLVTDSLNNPFTSLGSSKTLSLPSDVPTPQSSDISTKIVPVVNSIQKDLERTYSSPEHSGRSNSVSVVTNNEASVPPIAKDSPLSVGNGDNAMKSLAEQRSSVNVGAGSNCNTLPSGRGTKVAQAIISPLGYSDVLPIETTSACSIPVPLLPRTSIQTLEPLNVLPQISTLGSSKSQVGVTDTTADLMWNQITASPGIIFDALTDSPATGFFFSSSVSEGLSSSRRLSFSSSPQLGISRPLSSLLPHSIYSEICSSSPQSPAGNISVTSSPSLLNQTVFFQPAATNPVLHIESSKCQNLTNITSTTPSSTRTKPISAPAEITSQSVVLKGGSVTLTDHTSSSQKPSPVRLNHSESNQRILSMTTNVGFAMMTDGSQSTQISKLSNSEVLFKDFQRQNAVDSEHTNNLHPQQEGKVQGKLLLEKLLKDPVVCNSPHLQRQNTTSYGKPGEANSQSEGMLASYQPSALSGPNGENDSKPDEFGNHYNYAVNSSSLLPSRAETITSHLSITQQRGFLHNQSMQQASSFKVSQEPLKSLHAVLSSNQMQHGNTSVSGAQQTECQLLSVQTQGPLLTSFQQFDCQPHAGVISHPKLQVEGLVPVCIGNQVNVLSAHADLSNSSSGTNVRASNPNKMLSVTSVPSVAHLTFEAQSQSHLHTASNGQTITHTASTNQSHPPTEKVCHSHPQVCIDQIYPHTTNSGHNGPQTCSSGQTYPNTSSVYQKLPPITVSSWSDSHTTITCQSYLHTTSAGQIHPHTTMIGQRLPPTTKTGQSHSHPTNIGPSHPSTTENHLHPTNTGHSHPGTTDIGQSRSHTTATGQSHLYTSYTGQGHPGTTDTGQSHPHTSNTGQSHPDTTDTGQGQSHATDKVHSHPHTTNAGQSHPFISNTDQSQSHSTNSGQSHSHTSDAVHGHPHITNTSQAQFQSTAIRPSHPHTITTSNVKLPKQRRLMPKLGPTLQQQHGRAAMRSTLILVPDKPGYPSLQLNPTGVPGLLPGQTVQLRPLRPESEMTTSLSSNSILKLGGQPMLVQVAETSRASPGSSNQAQNPGANKMPQIKSTRKGNMNQPGYVLQGESRQLSEDHEERKTVLNTHEEVKISKVPLETATSQSKRSTTITVPIEGICNKTVNPSVSAPPLMVQVPISQKSLLLSSTGLATIINAENKAPTYNEQSDFDNVNRNPSSETQIKYGLQSIPTQVDPIKTSVDIEQRNLSSMVNQSSQVTSKAPTQAIHNISALKANMIPLGQRDLSQDLPCLLNKATHKVLRNKEVIDLTEDRNSPCQLSTVPSESADLNKDTIINTEKGLPFGSHLITGGDKKPLQSSVTASTVMTTFSVTSTSSGAGQANLAPGIVLNQLSGNMSGGNLVFVLPPVLQTPQGSIERDAAIGGLDQDINSPVKTMSLMTQNQAGNNLSSKVQSLEAINITGRTSNPNRLISSSSSLGTEAASVTQATKMIMSSIPVTSSQSQTVSILSASTIEPASISISQLPVSETKETHGPVDRPDLKDVNNPRAKSSVVGPVKVTSQISRPNSIPLSTPTPSFIRASTAEALAFKKTSNIPTDAVGPPNITLISPSETRPPHFNKFPSSCVSSLSTCSSHVQSSRNTSGKDSRIEMTKMVQISSVPFNKVSTQILFSISQPQKTDPHLFDKTEVAPMVSMEKASELVLPDPKGNNTADALRERLLQDHLNPGQKKPTKTRKRKSIQDYLAQKDMLVQVSNDKAEHEAELATRIRYSDSAISIHDQSPLPRERSISTPVTKTMQRSELSSISLTKVTDEVETMHSHIMLEKSRSLHCASNLQYLRQNQEDHLKDQLAQPSHEQQVLSNLGLKHSDLGGVPCNDQQTKQSADSNPLAVKRGTGNIGYTSTAFIEAKMNDIDNSFSQQSKPSEVKLDRSCEFVGLQGSKVRSNEVTNISSDKRYDPARHPMLTNILSREITECGESCKNLDDELSEAMVDPRYQGTPLAEKSAFTKDQPMGEMGHVYLSLSRAPPAYEEATRGSILTASKSWTSQNNIHHEKHEEERIGEVEQSSQDRIGRVIDNIYMSPMDEKLARSPLSVGAFKSTKSPVTNLGCIDEHNGSFKSVIVHDTPVSLPGYVEAVGDGSYNFGSKSGANSSDVQHVWKVPGKTSNKRFSSRGKGCSHYKKVQFYDDVSRGQDRLFPESNSRIICDTEESTLNKEKNIWIQPTSLREAETKHTLYHEQHTETNSKDQEERQPRGEDYTACQDSTTSQNCPNSLQYFGHTAQEPAAAIRSTSVKYQPLSYFGKRDEHEENTSLHGMIMRENLLDSLRDANQPRVCQPVYHVNETHKVSKSSKPVMTDCHADDNLSAINTKRDDSRDIHTAQFEKYIDEDYGSSSKDDSSDIARPSSFKIISAQGYSRLNRQRLLSTTSSESSCSPQVESRPFPPTQQSFTGQLEVPGKSDSYPAKTQYSPLSYIAGQSTSGGKRQFSDIVDDNKVSDASLAFTSRKLMPVAGASRQLSESPIHRHNVIQADYELSQKMMQNGSASKTVQRSETHHQRDASKAVVRIGKYEDRDLNLIQSPNSFGASPDEEIISSLRGLSYSPSCSSDMNSETTSKLLTGSPGTGDGPIGRYYNLIQYIDSIHTQNEELKRKVNLAEKQSQLRMSQQKDHRLLTNHQQEQHQTKIVPHAEFGYVDESESLKVLNLPNASTHHTFPHLASVSIGPSSSKDIPDYVDDSIHKGKVVPISVSHPSSMKPFDQESFIHIDEQSHSSVTAGNRRRHPSIGIKCLSEVDPSLHQDPRLIRLPRESPFSMGNSKLNSPTTEVVINDYIRNMTEGHVMLDSFATSVLRSPCQPDFIEASQSLPSESGSHRQRYPSSSELKQIAASSHLAHKQTIDTDGHLDGMRPRSLSSSLSLRLGLETDLPSSSSYENLQRQRNPSSSSIKDNNGNGNRSRNPSSSSLFRLLDIDLHGIRSRNPSGSSNRRSRPGSSSSDREFPIVNTVVDDLSFPDFSHSRSRNSSGDSNLEPSVGFMPLEVLQMYLTRSYNH